MDLKVTPYFITQHFCCRVIVVSPSISKKPTVVMPREDGPVQVFRSTRGSAKAGAKNWRGVCIACSWYLESEMKFIFLWLLFLNYFLHMNNLLLFPVSARDKLSLSTNFCSLSAGSWKLIFIAVVNSANKVSIDVAELSWIMPSYNINIWASVVPIII